MTQHFHSNGKLLLTAEFLIIDGAKALALPARYGQQMEVTPLNVPEIRWQSFAPDNQLWYQEVFDLQNNRCIPRKEAQNPPEITARLQQLLTCLQAKKPALFQQGYAFRSRLDFPRDWGLGSSSTLLANLARWAGVNPYWLSEKSFGGSAYDIACATHRHPLIYQRSSPLAPTVETVNFNPPFKDRLFFVHRNQKQNTRSVVRHYKELNPKAKQHWVEQASRLTERFLNCSDVDAFNALIVEHETLLAKVLHMKPVKISHFPDYPGALKSLGAWGGDFMLATGGTEERQYFKKRGFATILEYREMVFP